MSSWRDWKMKRWIFSVAGMTFHHGSFYAFKEARSSLDEGPERVKEGPGSKLLTGGDFELLQRGTEAWIRTQKRGCHADGLPLWYMIRGLPD
jgi:hypothetical protein